MKRIFCVISCLVTGLSMSAAAVVDTISPVRDSLMPGRGLGEEVRDTGRVPSSPRAGAAAGSVREDFLQAKEEIRGWFNDNIKANAVGEYAEVQRQNNQAFADMLRQPSSWSSYAMQRREREEYVDGRFFTERARPSSDTASGRNIRYASVLEPHGRMESPVPETYYAGAGTDAVSRMVSKQQDAVVKFYGESLRLVYEPSLKSIGFGKAKEKHIARFWQYLAGEDYGSVVLQLYQFKEDLHLNDYQYYQLVKAFADQMFAKGRNGEALGFTVFILNQTGYDARLARLSLEKKTEMVLLLPIWEEVYGMPYVVIGGNPYYLAGYELSPRDMRKAGITTYSKAFAAATSPLSIQSDPSFFGLDPLYGMFNGYVYNERLAEAELSLPAGPMSIYWNEPFNELMEKTFRYRLKPNFDSIVQKRQDANLQERISDEGRRQMLVLQLSSFIDRNLSTQAKKSSRLAGRYLYPDLMFWKKGSGDIWDRSVLFCQVSNRILGIPAVMLVYPGFAMPAVSLSPSGIAQGSPFSGADYVEYGGKRYYLLGKIPKSVDTSMPPALMVWQEE